MTVYLDDNARLTPIDRVKHLAHPRDLELLNVQVGDVVEHMGHCVTWDEDCVTPEITAQWRMQGDQVCDAALEEIFSNGSPAGQDLYSVLESYVSSKGIKSQSPAVLFWHEVHRIPPDGIRASESDTVLARQLFLDCSVQIMQALLYYSLAGGFASPRIVRTLRAVSYLVPPSTTTESKAFDDRTFTRLLETFQFVLDVMGCTATPRGDNGSSQDKEPNSMSYLLPGGEGWKAAIRVRMLHGVARNRVMKKWAKDAKLDGKQVPISQEDMSATLASFSTIPLWALSLLQVRPTRKVAEAYLATWRHVGFYLGVDPSIISRYFSSVPTSDHFLASTTYQLFTDDFDMNLRDNNDSDSITARAQTSPTMPILRAVSNRPPLRTRLSYNCALARHLLGPELSNHLSIPQSSIWMTHIKLPIILFVQRYPVWFSRTYGYLIRPKFLEKRRFVMTEGMVRSVRGSMGMRRTDYRPREDVDQELDEETKEKEKVVPDFAGGHALVRAWKEVLVEMVGVSIIIGLGMGWGFSWVVRALLG